MHLVGTQKTEYEELIGGDDLGEHRKLSSGFIEAKLLKYLRVNSYVSVLLGKLHIS